MSCYSHLLVARSIKLSNALLTARLVAGTSLRGEMWAGVEILGPGDPGAQCVMT